MDASPIKRDELFQFSCDINIWLQLDSSSVFFFSSLYLSFFSSSSSETTFFSSSFTRYKLCKDREDRNTEKNCFLWTKVFLCLCILQKYNYDNTVYLISFSSPITHGGNNWILASGYLKETSLNEYRWKLESVCMLALNSKVWNTMYF